MKKLLFLVLVISNSYTMEPSPQTYLGGTLNHYPSETQNYRNPTLEDQSYYYQQHHGMSVDRLDLNNYRYDYSLQDCVYRSIDFDFSSRDVTYKLVDPFMKKMHQLYLDGGQIEELERYDRFLIQKINDYKGLWGGVKRFFDRRSRNEWALERRHSFVQRIFRYHQAHQPRTYGYDVRTYVGLDGKSYRSDPLVERVLDIEERVYIYMDSDVRNVLRVVLNGMKADGLFTKPIQQERVSIARIMKKYVALLPPNTSKDLILKVTKHATWCLVQIYAGNKFNMLSQSLTTAMQMYDLSNVDFSSMNIEEYETFIAEQMVEITYGLVVGETIKRVVPKISTNLSQAQSPSAATQHTAQVVTPEGVKVDVPAKASGTSTLMNEATRGINNVPKISSIKELFRNTKFGQTLESNSYKLNQTYKGARIFRIHTNINDFLKKGYHFYLDTLHYDHIEVFDKNKTFRHVINLDGSFNKLKTEAALLQGRAKIKI